MNTSRVMHEYYTVQKKEGLPVPLSFASIRLASQYLPVTGKGSRFILTGKFKTTSELLLVLTHKPE